MPGVLWLPGAAILNFGDYNDQIAEIGRLVVDPAAGRKGLGRTLFDAVDASDDRVEFASARRTTHVKTQRIFDRVGLVPWDSAHVLHDPMA
jgi:predicted GNAT family N-acyltransferase